MVGAMTTRIPRIIDGLLAELLQELPAVMIVGPRAIGKTTTAVDQAATVVRLDREAEAAAVRADPDVVLASLKLPALIDEWQRVPEVLDAVKRAVDHDFSPGSWILTGSVRADLLDASRAATGRIVRLRQWGLTQRELEGRVRQPSFFERIRFESPGFGSAAGCDLADYVSMTLRSGFPEALGLSERARRHWLDGYIDQTVRRDAEDLGEDRDPVALRRYLVALAANTAGVPSDKTLYDAAGISRVTAHSYERVLEMLFVTSRVPAWHSNRLKRLIKSPKRVLVEPAMIAPLLGVEQSVVLRDGDLLGRMIESFVFAQLRAETTLISGEVTLHHLRTDDGRREIDVIAEYPDGRVVAIEIKATSSPALRDARHLDWLAHRLGDRLIAGIVFHTGPHAFELNGRVRALPLSAIWSAT